jgi:anthranilate/para-aminobenzoate synthase component II
VGISVAAIQHFAGKLPTAFTWPRMIAAFGGSIIRSQQLMNGKICDQHHAAGRVC